MRAMGMLDGDIDAEQPAYLIKHQQDITTAAKGHIHFFFNEYDAVSKGQKLFEIRCPQTLAVLDQACAPFDGVMGVHTYRAISEPGDYLCQVCRIEKLPLPPCPALCFADAQNAPGIMKNGLKND